MEQVCARGAGAALLMGGERAEGEPGKARSCGMMGYDNFKQSSVATAIDTTDTAMRRAEGDMDPGGKALLRYGTIDEYLTGELVWRFPSDDEVVLEIHDLPIGERDPKVVETRYRRRSQRTPHMGKLTAERHVKAPPERVFEAATDFRKAPERVRAITRIEVLTEGPTRLGTRFRETRVLFKREATEEMEVTAFDPPRGYTLGAESHGCRYRTELRFEPADGGTKLTMSFEATPLTFGARVMTVLFKAMSNWMMKECEKDLDDIKAWCEAPGR